MTTQIFRFLNLLMAGLVAGTLFGIWIGYNPKNLSVNTYVEHQQGVIKALNTLMPILGLILIILTVISAILQKQNQFVFVTLIIAAGFLLISGLITKFGNQPINSVVMTWSKASTPINWSELRDKWWLLHKLRTLTTFISFCLIIWSNIRNN
jgi:hypothetical protein